jgi:hypothetical protein
MKGVNAVLAAAALALALSLPSWAQEVKQLTHTVTLAGTVETIDHDKHLMNIKTADGVFNTVDVPPSVKRFDEVKVGDKVSVTYNNTVFVKLKPPGEAAADTGSQTSTMGQEARPGGTAPSITFVGPNGWKYSRRVADPDVLDKLKVGDQVDITWNTSVTVAVD